MTHSNEIVETTVTAPVNIAVIKYWGKRDVKQMLPTNSSLSLTLSQDHMRSKTTGRLSAKFTTDSIFLNGVEEPISGNARMNAVVNAIRVARKNIEDRNPSHPKLHTLGLRVVSENNFPTAAGLASSAAGFAALAFCLANLFQLDYSLAEISTLARLGSGSACRSLYGGYVEWQMGACPVGTDSIAVQVAPASHWQMSALVLVASDTKKHTSSSAGMQTTVATSELLQHRIKHVVPQRMTAMKQAIIDKDFDTFAELTMKDSNQFHAVCLDTFPPISYLTAVSFAVISVITAYNEVTKTGTTRFRACYTFDAGPNAVIYAPDERMNEIVAVVDHFFPMQGVDVNEYYGQQRVSKSVELTELITKMEVLVSVKTENALKRIISTRIGEGPCILSNSYDETVSLMNVGGDVRL